jgi:hypothetical protein
MSIFGLREEDETARFLVDTMNDIDFSISFAENRVKVGSQPIISVGNYQQARRFVENN